jgi:hypothetical protein
MASAPYKGPILPVFGISVSVPGVPVENEKVDGRGRPGRPRVVDRLVQDRPPPVHQHSGPSADVQMMQEGWQLYQRLLQGLEYVALRTPLQAQAPK